MGVPEANLPGGNRLGSMHASSLQDSCRPLSLDANRWLPCEARAPWVRSMRARPQPARLLQTWVDAFRRSVLLVRLATSSAYDWSAVTNS